MSAFIKLGTQRLADLPGAGASGYGTATPLILSPGRYEVRIVGGPVVVKEGPPPVSRNDNVVVQEAPMFFKTDGTITLAAQTTVPARAYVTRIAD